MITTTIIQIVTDEDNNVYDIGDRVRVKMKPRNAEKPELTSEYIGYIDDIKEGVVDVCTDVGVRRLDVNRIDKIRFAADNEDFNNTWDF